MLTFVHLYINEMHLRITFHIGTNKVNVIAASSGRRGAAATTSGPQPLHCDNATKEAESAYRRLCVYFHH